MRTCRLVVNTISVRTATHLMLNVKGIEEFYFALWLIVPGAVMLSVRAQLLTGRVRSHAENLLNYIVFSLIYYALTFPFIEPVLSLRGGWGVRAIVWVALTVLGPAVFGLGLGIVAQKEWPKWLTDKLGLNVVHPSPTAWDWRFARIPAGGIFVMVTLSNNASVAGLLRFASSDVAERDLYLEEEWDVSDQGQWTKRPEKVGILIPAKEIKYVEFWEPTQDRGASNGK